MSRQPSVLHRYIDQGFLEASQILEAKYDHDRLRFDRATTNEMLYAKGRIGKRYFEFTLNDDLVVLVIGSPLHRGGPAWPSGPAEEDSGSSGAASTTTGPNGHSVRYTPLMTTDPLSGRSGSHAGNLLRGPVSMYRRALTKSGLFTEMLGSLRRCRTWVSAGRLQGYYRRSSTRPMDHTPGLIRKPSKSWR
jgi:hypothetical protein